MEISILMNVLIREKLSSARSIGTSTMITIMHLSKYVLVGEITKNNATNIYSRKSNGSQK